MPLNKLFIDAARKGAVLAPGDKMCAGCAFRPGTEANSDEEFIEMAAAQIAQGCNFKCHLIDQDCVGFKYMKQYMDSIED